MTNKSTARLRADNAFAALRPYAEPPTIVNELIAVLAPHPKGLRRWSVMRAIRDIRNKDSRAMSLKFEIEVERAFRGACSNCAEGNNNPDAPFFRPEGKAGEVWALHPRHNPANVSESAPESPPENVSESVPESIHE